MQEDKRTLKTQWIEVTMGTFFTVTSQFYPVSYFVTGKLQRRIKKERLDPVSSYASRDKLSQGRPTLRTSRISCCTAFDRFEIGLTRAEPGVKKNAEFFYPASGK